MWLTREQRYKIAATKTQEPWSVAAPIKGWNTRDALDAMDPQDAVTLDNFYPDAGGCVVRQGIATYASGMGSGSQAVKTLAEYSNGSTHTFIAACGGKI